MDFQIDSHVQLGTTSFFSTLRDWKIELGPIWDWFVELIVFNYHTYGWRGILAIIGLIFIAGFVLPPTRYLTSIIINNILRFVFTIIQVSFALCAMIITKFGVVVGVAALREAGTQLSSIDFTPPQIGTKEKKNTD